MLENLNNIVSIVASLMGIVGTVSAMVMGGRGAKKAMQAKDGSVGTSNQSVTITGRDNSVHQTIDNRDQRKYITNVESTSGQGASGDDAVVVLIGAGLAMVVVLVLLGRYGLLVLWTMRVALLVMSACTVLMCVIPAVRVRSRFRWQDLSGSGINIVLALVAAWSLERSSINEQLVLAVSSGSNVSSWASRVMSLPSEVTLLVIAAYGFLGIGAAGAFLALWNTTRGAFARVGGGEVRPVIWFAVLGSVFCGLSMMATSNGALTLLSGVLS
ncbi:hypothetical protein [Actinomyces sp.]|uniref:hypothetical protein n=1 Tax=Actinomyces sp. TaxID=29317 RepID=UPI0026DDB484|nr:hypothetical protein [Actinomyces sp.]MDO4900195.1 hypothetical protein [Actinomyces sp.]